MDPDNNNLECTEKDKIPEKSQPLLESISNFLETPLECRRRKYSRWIIYFTTFIQSVGFSIVLTGVWPYLEQLESEPNKELLGWVIAANPIGQLIFSPLIGWLCTLFNSIRAPSILCLIVFIVSNAWYALLPLHQTNAQYFMMGARFLVGASSGSITACRTYITQGTLLSERTPTIAFLSLFQAVGFTLGPAVQVALTPLGENGISLGGRLNLSMYTAAGWTAMLFGIINLILYHPKLFYESDIGVKEYAAKAKLETTYKMMLVCIQMAIISDKLLSVEEEFNWSSAHPDYLALMVVVISFFIVLFNFSLLESLGAPAVMDQFGWSRTEAVRNFGISMTISSILSVFFFFTIGPLCRRFDERYILIFLGMIPMLIGRIFFFGFSGEVSPMKRFGCRLNGTVYFDQVACGDAAWIEVQHGCPQSQTWCFEIPALKPILVAFGVLVGTIGYPYCVALLQTLYSKILGPRPQGTWNGALTGVVSLSKIIGSILLVYLYKNYGHNVTSTVVTILMAFSTLLVVFFRKRLVPFQMKGSMKL